MSTHSPEVSTKSPTRESHALPKFTVIYSLDLAISKTWKQNIYPEYRLVLLGYAFKFTYPMHSHLECIQIGGTAHIVTNIIWKVILFYHEL